MKYFTGLGYGMMLNYCRGSPLCQSLLMCGNADRDAQVQAAGEKLGIEVVNDQKATALTATAADPLQDADGRE